MCFDDTLIARSVCLKMPENDHIGQLWSYNRMQRMIKEGERVYERCLRRKVYWPEQTTAQQAQRTDCLKDVRLDDAFSSFLRFMSQATQQCKRYYDVSPSSSSNAERRHCCRYHTPQYTALHHRNQLKICKGTHIMVPNVSNLRAANSSSQTFAVHAKSSQTKSVRFTHI